MRTEKKYNETPFAVQRRKKERDNGHNTARLSKNAVSKRPIRVLTWPIRVNTVVPLWAAYGLEPVVISTL